MSWGRATYEYLAVSFSCKENTNTIVKKTYSRSCCLKKLRSFDICPKILQMFFTCFILSVLTFTNVCWSGNISKNDCDIMYKIIIGKRHDKIDTNYQRRLTNKLTDVLHDDKFRLKTDFDNKIIQCSGRLRMPRIRTTRYSGSFVSSAIKAFNTKKCRGRNDI